ncbi:hypothetical protein ABLV56_11250 [Klebsiella sp. JB_Kp029]|uniref:hypothetical protein n=1 Tax=unclassified Klebsiella TaxID=2608929 RepID=UPI0032B48260
MRDFTSGERFETDINVLKLTLMPVMILFPTEKESASLPYSFPHKLFDAEFLTKMVSHKGVLPRYTAFSEV